MKFIKTTLLALALTVTGFAQQPQTSDLPPLTPPFHVDATTANGVAPGYKPTGNSTGLTLTIGPGTSFFNNTIYNYSGGTLSMTNGTNYVYINETNGTPTVSSSTFTSGQFPLAVVVASGGNITGIADLRTLFTSAGGGSGGSTGFASLTSGVNTSANMQVGSGAQLSATGGGIINATAENGVSCTGTPTVGQSCVATSSTTATWQTTAAGSGVQYNPSNTSYVIWSDSRGIVSSSCYLSNVPDTASITSGSITGGVLTAVTSTNHFAIPTSLTLSGFTGGAAGLNGQVVNLTSATSTSIVGPVTGISSLGSTGTGTIVGCSYNLSGQLRLEPFLNGHGTVINQAQGGLTSALALSEYTALVHPYSPIVTGTPGYLIIQVGGQDWLNPGFSLSGTEANIQSLLTLARADQWTGIILTTVIPHNPSLYNNPPSDIISMNAFIRALAKSSATVATGAYADWIEDAAQLFPDPSDPRYVLQSGTESGHLTDVGAGKWADDLNANFANQRSALFPNPNYCGPWIDLACLNETNSFPSTQTFQNIIVNGTCTGSGCSSSNPLSGMTTGQVPIAASPTTVTSSKPIAGSGSGLTSGPTSTTSGDCVQFANTSGQISDTGSPCGSGGGAVSSVSNSDGSLIISPTTGAVVASLASKYKTWSCQPGLGDGANAIPSGTYLSSTCMNTTGATVTITGVKCFSDNNGTSTLNASGNTLGALLTGAVTCTTSFASGTQSANVALTNGDFIKFTFVADGTSKQTTWVVTGTY